MRRRSSVWVSPEHRAAERREDWLRRGPIAHSITSSARAAGERLADALLAEAVRAGWLTPPAIIGGGPPPRKPIMRFRELKRELRHDREDR